MSLSVSCNIQSTVAGKSILYLNSNGYSAQSYTATKT